MKTKLRERYRVNAPELNEDLQQLSVEMGAVAIEEDVVELLCFFLKQHRPKVLLEVGSGIGYSASIFAEILPESTIITLEKDEERFIKAKEVLEPYANVTCLNQDGLDYLDQTKETFDAIFIDGAKSIYHKVLLKAEKHLSYGSVILADNIFCRGITFEKEVKRKHKKMKEGILAFLDHIDSGGYEYILLPIGDGVLYAIKK